MSGIIGKKIGMTSIYDESGKNIPCTILEVGPCTITQIKTDDKDGYSSFQLGFDEKTKNTTKSYEGHFKKSKSKTMNKLVEFKGFNGDYKLGDKITVDHFVEGEFVDVSGITKGKGFQGVVKRHGFAGVGDSTHGQHNRMRAPGSIGAGSDPSRVFKGMRMAGQTGNSKVKVLNLKVVKVMSEDNILIVKGSVPGHNNSYITVRK
ncbi:50S ribosomal protein L3 [Flavobacteriaceae bacterium]|nr:50S ribosomal protein L3 [Flavobacteriaceae bacterium]